MDTINEKFGQSLKEIRKKNGWTQEELAKKLNTTKQVISKYEKSQRSPNIYVARDYAKALGVTLEEMLKIARDYPDDDFSNRSTPKCIPLLGAVAAGEPIYSEESGVYVNAVLSADCAVVVEGDSMEPTYLENDILYIRAQPTIDYEGQVAVVICGDEACVKHVYRQKDAVMLISDNPKYPPMIKKFADYDGNIRVLGTVIGYTRMYSDG